MNFDFLHTPTRISHVDVRFKKLSAKNRKKVLEMGLSEAECSEYGKATIFTLTIPEEDRLMVPQKMLRRIGEEFGRFREYDGCHCWFENPLPASQSSN